MSRRKTDIERAHRETVEYLNRERHGRALEPLIRPGSTLPQVCAPKSLHHPGRPLALPLPTSVRTCAGTPAAVQPSAAFVFAEPTDRAGYPPIPLWPGASFHRP